MTTFKLKNFSKNNTPRWASQIGNSALIIGAFFASAAATATAIESYFEVVPANLVDILAYAKLIGATGGLICGFIKTLSKLFGIPLKDVENN